MFAVRSRNFHLSLMLATALAVSMLPSAGPTLPSRSKPAARTRFGLRRGDSGCRGCHSLHDQEQIAIDAGMPGVLQTRARSHGRTGRGRKAAQHQAGQCAKTCQRKPVQIQKTCEAGRDLIGPWVRSERSRHYSDSVCSRKLPPLPCKANARRGRMRWSLMPACKIARSLHQRPSRLAFRCAATHGVPQKPTPPINQGLRHN
jgi:hypothetical protein